MRALLLVVALAGCSAERATAPELPAPRVVSEPYVYVLGEVQHPGRYRLIAPTPLTRILAVAKLTPLSWQPTITRTTPEGRKVRVRVSLAKIEEGEAADVRLFPGDVVFVDVRTF